MARGLGSVQVPGPQPALVKAADGAARCRHAHRAPGLGAQRRFTERTTLWETLSGKGGLRPLWIERGDAADVVEPLQLILGQVQIDRPQIVGELLWAPGADDRAGDGGAAEEPGECHLRRCDA